MKKLNFILLLCAVSLLSFSQLKVSSNGNVGIGVSNPTEKLEIAGAIRGNQNGALRVNTGNGNIDLGPLNNWCAHIQTDLSKFYFNKEVCLGDPGMLYSYRDNPLYLGTYWGNSYVITITANSTVGINTTEPQYTLDVNGDIATYGTLQIYSDEKIKENILPLDGCLSKLAMINGKSYYKKVRPEYMTKKSSLSKALSDTTYLKQTETDKQLEIGLIAQEVETVFPELVKTDKNGLRSVNYIGLIPVLIESIKEQQKQIGNLTNQLKSISSQSSKAPSFAPIKQPNSLDETLPASLYQNNPNPFSQSTQIKYYLPKTVNKALLCIYDLQGKQLKQINISTRGEGTQTISGAEFSAGIYLYGLIADGQQVDVKRMILTE